MTIHDSKSVVSPNLIGRSHEVEAIQLLIERTNSGQGQTALISGEAGVGKSRLVSQTSAYAAAQGFLCLQGNCFQPDTACPYAPFIDLLRNGIPEGPVQERLLLLSELTGSTAVSSSLDLEQAKRRLFENLSRFFIRRSVQQPVALVIEDIHWNDDTSLEFLYYLIRQCTSQRVLLLLTYRSDEIQPSLRRSLAQFDRSHVAQELSLERLTQSEVGQMLRGIFALDQPLSPELIGIVHSLTDGNPFFIEEVLKSLITAGQLFQQDGTWNRKPVNELLIPRSIQDAVLQRFEQLSNKSCRIAILAAVIGRRFDFSLLQQLTQLDESQLLEAMKELIAAQLVVEESDDQFAFRHALTRQAIYSTLLTRERKHLHQSIVHVLETRYANAFGPRSAELAYHAYKAGDWQTALKYSLVAGELAQSLYAPQVAIEHFTQGLNAAQHLSISPAAKLYHARGLAYESVGEFKQARADLEAALHAAQVAQDGHLEWQVLLDLGMLWAGQDYAQTGKYYRQAYDRARGLDDQMALAHSLNRLGNWHVNVDQPVDGHWYHQEALRTFEQAEDRSGIAQTLNLLGVASLIGGNLVQSAEYLQRAVVLFQELEDRRGLLASLTSLGMRGPSYQTDTMIGAGSLAEAARDGDLALQLAPQTGQRADEAFALIFLSITLGAAGEYQRALPLARKALATADEIDHRQWLTASHLALGALYLDVLALQPAQHHFELALSLATESGSLHWVRNSAGMLASTYIVQSRPELAETLLNRTLDPALQIQTLGQRLLWRARIELTLTNGDGNAALQMLDRLTDTLMTAPGRSYSVRLLMLRAEALMLLQQHAEAEETLQIAYNLTADLGIRSLQWRIHLSLARLCQFQKRYSQAEQCLKQAQALVEALAANIPEQALQDSFQQQAMALIKKPLKAEYGGLTPREHEVAALIALSKSNRQMAETLVVSKRTIETHVENILSKLHFTSRAQIAVWMVEQGSGSHPD
jgi:DNA-binding CsgD family transcriptional regulator